MKRLRDNRLTRHIVELLKQGKVTEKMLVAAAKEMRRAHAMWSDE